MTLLRFHRSNMFPQDTPDKPTHFHRIVRIRIYHNMPRRLVDSWSTGREYHRFGRPRHFRSHNTERGMLRAYQWGRFFRLVVRTLVFREKFKIGGRRVVDLHLTAQFISYCGHNSTFGSPTGIFLFRIWGAPRRRYPNLTTS